MHGDQAPHVQKGWGGGSSALVPSPAHLKVFLDGDAAHRRPDLAENPQGQLAPRLAGTLGTENHLQRGEGDIPGVKSPLGKG